MLKTRAYLPKIALKPLGLTNILRSAKKEALSILIHLRHPIAQQMVC
jgi:hypothetical protein